MTFSLIIPVGLLALWVASAILERRQRFSTQPHIHTLYCVHEVINGR